MTSMPHTSSARIYPFVPRSRGAPTVRGEAEVVELRPAVPSGLVRCPAVGYHEAAIAEERARKG